jgi:hypothetical protein
MARHGWAWQAEPGCGEGRARRGMAWLGWARLGSAGLGVALARPGWAGRGMVLAGLGMAWLLATPTGARAPTAPQIIPVEVFRPVVAPVIVDPMFRPSLAPRPHVAVAEPEIIIEEPRVDEVRPEASLGRSLTGGASWYCKAGVSVCHYKYPDGPGFDAYAAAGGPLRRALGPTWRGSVVLVNGIRVKLVDWCGCPEGRIIDLYWDVAHALGISGVGRVTIRW